MKLASGYTAVDTAVLEPLSTVFKGRLFRTSAHAREHVVEVASEIIQGPGTAGVKEKQDLERS